MQKTYKTSVAFLYSRISREHGRSCGSWNFLATKTFSAEAKREAAREGAAPIEMVDLDALISLLTELRLGVAARTVFTVDHSFFQEYGPPEKDGAS